MPLTPDRSTVVSVICRKTKDVDKIRQRCQRKIIGQDEANAKRSDRFVHASGLEHLSWHSISRDWKSAELVGTSGSRAVSNSYTSHLASLHAAKKVRRIVLRARKYEKQQERARGRIRNGAAPRAVRNFSGGINGLP